MRNVDLYKALVQQSQPALLCLVIAQAQEKDFAALKDFIHVMDQVGSNVSLFSRPREVTTMYHDGETENDAADFRSNTSSFPGAMISAIEPFTYDNGGNKKSRAESMQETVTDEAIDFLQHAVKVGTTNSSAAFNSPKEREYFLSFMLFQAASKTSDVRVFNTLIAAGANPAQKFISNHKDEFGKRKISVFKEAMLFGNHPGATVLLDLMEPRKVVEAIAVMTEGPRDPGTSLGVTFHEIEEVKMMCQALNQGQHAQVGDLLDKICEKAEAHGTGGDGGQRIGGYFRCLLADSFLRSVRRRFNNDWTDVAVAAIRGEAGKFKPGSTIEGHALNWNDYTTKGGRTQERWSLMNEQADSIEMTSYRYIMAELVQHAVMTHCLPILQDVESYVQPVTSTAYSTPDIGTAVFMTTCEVPLVNPFRFRATIEFLMDHGHSINAIAAHHAHSGAPLHVLARASEPSVSLALPVLLTMGADHNALNAKGETAWQSCMCDVAQKTWLSIQRSFDARTAAHKILSELENLEIETQTHSKSPRP